MNTKIFTALSFAGLMIGCAQSDFSSSANSKSPESKPQTTNSESILNDGSSSANSDATLGTGSGEITKVTYSDTSGAIMFRGTRGINLMTMEIGIPLNPSDLDKLKASKGQSVASGLRTEGIGRIMLSLF